MSTRLYVGDLGWGTTDEGLAAAFGGAGAFVSAHVETETVSGRSRGFGYVTFETREAADAALAELDGSRLDGRNIRVRIAIEPAKLDTR